jgi:hypothetical protein
MERLASFPAACHTTRLPIAKPAPAATRSDVVRDRVWSMLVRKHGQLRLAGHAVFGEALLDDKRAAAVVAAPRAERVVDDVDGEVEEVDDDGKRSTTSRRGGACSDGERATEGARHRRIHVASRSLESTGSRNRGRCGSPRRAMPPALLSCRAADALLGNQAPKETKAADRAALRPQGMGGIYSFSRSSTERWSALGLVMQCLVSSNRRQEGGGRAYRFLRFTQSEPAAVPYCLYCV